MRLLLWLGILVLLAAGAFVLWEPRRAVDLPLVQSSAQPAGQRLEDTVRGTLQPPVEGQSASAEPETSLAPRLELSQGKLPWEEKIEAVLNAPELSATAKARQLFAILPGMPEHGYTRAAEEAAALLTDADFNNVALPLLTNPQTHGLVTSVLFADLMERPQSLMLPALLRIAQIPQHPYAKYARENLDLLLGEDFGSDWLKWDQAIRTAISTGPKTDVPGEPELAR